MEAGCGLSPWLEQKARAGGAGQAATIKDLISHAQFWVKPLQDSQQA